MGREPNSSGKPLTVRLLTIEKPAVTSATPLTVTNAPTPEADKFYRWEVRIP